MVAKNTVTGWIAGISVSAADSKPGGAQIRRNVTNGNTFGIQTTNDLAPFVWCNTANDNELTASALPGGGKRL